MSTNWPNFFIVGAAKAGTTSLYRFLAQHPQVFMSGIKEPHFFSAVSPRKEQKDIVKTVSDERCYRRLFEGSAGYIAVGESSPSYLSELGTAERINRIIPDAKAIILLRDPIARAHSHYLMDVRTGIQRQSFWDAIQSDYAKSEKGWGVSHMYVELGMYHLQVKHYLDVFGRKRVLILTSEELSLRTCDALCRVAMFLGIDPAQFKEVDVTYPHNQFAAPSSKFALSVLRSQWVKLTVRLVTSVKFRQHLRDRFLLAKTAKPEIDAQTKEFLRSIYEPELEKLEALLETPMPSLKRW